MHKNDKKGQFVRTYNEKKTYPHNKAKTCKAKCRTYQPGWHPHRGGAVMRCGQGQDQGQRGR